MSGETENAHSYGMSIFPCFQALGVTEATFDGRIGPDGIATVKTHCDWSLGLQAGEVKAKFPRLKGCL
jgi:hypothetical protein